MFRIEEKSVLSFLNVTGRRNKRNFSLLGPITFFLFVSLCPLSAQETEVWKYALGQDLISKQETYWEKELQPGTTLCFTGNFITEIGKIRYISPPKKILNLGLSRGTRWFPLISFSSPKAGESVLSAPDLRKQLLVNLEDFLQNNPEYSGVHLDFEGLHPSYREDYKDLLSEIRPRFRELGKIISVALFPQEEFSKQLAGFHSAIYKQNLADEIVLMAYDFHSPKTAPGPVTEYSWTRKNMDLLLRVYKPNQIWLGIPLYGYFWEKTKARPKLLTRSKDRNFALENGLEKEGIYIIKTKTGEGSLILEDSFWSEYSRSLKLRGLAFWRLGF